MVAVAIYGALYVDQLPTGENASRSWVNESPIIIYGL
jgi:hypothetical protein